MAFFLGEPIKQFAEDAGPMAHPVRPDSYVEINNFYTATVYEKGAEVVRMMQTLVGDAQGDPTGRAGFARGMTLYFERHDGQAVTCDDFVQAMADANPASPLAQHLAQFKRWYSQAGTPRVRATGQYDAATRSYTLTLAQSCAPTPGQHEKLPFVIPVELGLVDAATGAALPLQIAGEEPAGGATAPGTTSRVIVLTEATHTLTFTGVDAEPVPSLLRGFSAPVALDIDYTDAQLLTLLAHDTDAFNRWEAGQRLALRFAINAIAAGAIPESAGGQFGTEILSAAYVEALRAVLRGERFISETLKQTLASRDAEPWCGVLIVNLSTGDIVEWIGIEGHIKELFDVAVIPGAHCPMALGGGSTSSGKARPRQASSQPSSSPAASSSEPRRSAWREAFMPVPPPGAVPRAPGRSRRRSGRRSGWPACAAAGRRRSPARCAHPRRRRRGRPETPPRRCRG